MRSLLLSASILFGLSGAALGQPMTDQGVPPGANLETGARPGNPIGTKDSLPRGNTASNINESDVHSRIAPNLPTPRVGDEASAGDYLQNARDALMRGRTGEAQEALERAQTRLMEDRQMNNGQVDNDAIHRISDARQALASHDRARAEELIDSAMNTASR
jgi:hypothetical protein